MPHHSLFTSARRLLLILAAIPLALISRASGEGAQLAALIESGSFSQAEQLLREQIRDPRAPVTDEAAVQLEILRRTRRDFSLTAEDVLRQLRESIPDISQGDIDVWRDAGDLQFRVIDGDVRYFRDAVPNLFRFNEQARKRRVTNAGDDKAFDLTAHVRELVQMSESAEGPEIHSVRHRVVYELKVNENHLRVKPGAMVRAWLPFPQAYRQQREVRLISADPPPATIAKDAPQRTIYFEQTLGEDAKPPRFRVEFEYVISAYCPKLDAAKVQPYDVDSAKFREFTAERPPHIVFTPEVKRLAREIVAEEQNPLEKARRIFRWVSKNIPWCSEMEYSIIPNLSAKGLAARRGDCGVKGMTFITLCRAAGVPARWQSGWQLRPGDWGMHDWAEFYVAPWGWLPGDASYGVREDDDPRVRDFFCGNMDAYRLIVNLDYARPLEPPKTSFRSEPNDFQRGEIEIDGHNLYYDEWDWSITGETTPLDEPAAARAGGGK